MNATVIQTGGRPRLLHPQTDRPGEFAMIHKDKLTVDERYQRDSAKAKAKVADIARNWSWIAFGALSVALREDGEWFIMDGGHRWQAAKLRPEIGELPCLVYDLDDIRQEAQGFLDINTARKQMASLARFKAKIIIGDKAALVVDELLTRAGLVPQEGGSPGGVSCVGVLMDLARDDELVLRRIWPILVDLLRGKRMTQYHAMAMWQLEKNLEDGQTLTEKNWRDRIMAVGAEEIMAAISTAAAYHQVARGRNACAIGLANALNKGRRNLLKHKITAGGADK